MVKYKEIYGNVLPILESKLDEIKYYEYDSITIEDIWKFCIDKRWRKKNVEELRLYEIVETIYSIKPSEIVSHFQIQQFQTTNWFSELNQAELNELLRPNLSESD